MAQVTVNNVKQDYSDESFLSRSFDGNQPSICLGACHYIETVARNGIQEVARSIGVSSTNQIKHFAAFGTASDRPVFRECQARPREIQKRLMLA
jgi:hypothetical protein